MVLLPAHKEKKNGKFTGKWIARFSYKNIKGDTKREFKRGFESKKAALEYERDFLSRRTHSLSMTFQGLAEMYLNDSKSRVRESTFKTKNGIFTKKLIPHFKEMGVEDITPLMIREWQNELLQSGHSQTYLKRINTELSAVMNYAVKFMGLYENPVRKAGSMGSKKPGKEMMIWGLEEFNTFINNIRDEQKKRLFTVLYWSGCRIGEVLALTKKDVLFHKNSIKITKTFQVVDKKELIGPPKTKASIREVTLIPEVMEKLREQIDTGYKLGEDDRLFPLTAENVLQYLKRNAKRLQLKPIRTHDLRHSHASLLIEIGVNIVAISKRLGHENVSTTLDTYSHLMEKGEKQVISMISDAYNQKKES